MLIFGEKNGTLRVIMIYYMKLYKYIYFRGVVIQNITKRIRLSMHKNLSVYLSNKYGCHAIT